jgi:peptidoglycan LD-endopeptidase CwlK
MNRIIYLIFLIFLSKINLAQTLLTDSFCEDTVLMSNDIRIISKKLGPVHDSILFNLRCLKVDYYGFNDLGNVDSLRLRTGVLIVHRSVEEDLKHIFEELKQLKFPIHSVIPVNKFGLNADSSGWNDAASMEANNSSAFNYRFITLSTDLSPHAFGTAIDFNPRFNPYEKYAHDGKFVEPENAFYDPERPGTVTDGRIVGLFDQRGWVWGGRWNNPVDYQHFDLRKDRGRKHYLMKESFLKMYFSLSEKGDISIYNSKYLRKMEKSELEIKKEDFNAFAACLDSLGNQCPEVWTKADSLKRKSFEPLFRQNNLKGLKVEICPSNSAMKHWNRYCALLLKRKLNEAGASAQLCGEDQNANADLRIAIEIGNSEIKSKDDFQLIYVPGAFMEKDLQSEQGRLEFLNLLIADDLPKSTALAGKIQQSLYSALKLNTLDRQLPGPNILQDACIKTDLDGVYCRNLSFFSRNYCPQLYVSLFNENTAVNEIFVQPKKGFTVCEKIADAIFDGIRDFYGR